MIIPYKHNVGLEEAYRRVQELFSEYCDDPRIRGLRMREDPERRIIYAQAKILRFSVSGKARVENDYVLLEGDLPKALEVCSAGIIRRKVTSKLDEKFGEN